LTFIDSVAEWATEWSDKNNCVIYALDQLKSPAGLVASG